jgi:hypothetical protein
MIAPRGTKRMGTRRGFSLLEVQAAFLILGFSVAALFPFAVAQYRLVGALERRLPPGVNYALVSRDHRMVTLLVAGPGSSSTSSTATNPAASQGPQLDAPVQSSTSTRAVVIDAVGPANGGGMGGNDMTATVVVKKQTPPGGQ